MTKTYCVKTTPKLFVTPPPFFVGVKLHVLPLPFCSPTPLPIISDQSLNSTYAVAEVGNFMEVVNIVVVKLFWDSNCSFSLSAQLKR